MHNQVIEVFNNEILAKGVDEFYDLLASYQFMLARLGKSQYDMANTLFGEFSDLNFKLLVEASNYKNAGYAKDITDIPRIPGETMVILADRSNLDTQKLSDLLGETVSIMRSEKDFIDNVKNILGSDFDIDGYPLDFTKENEEPQEAFALLPKNKVSATNFKLAQQIAGVPIIAEIASSRTSTLPNVSSRPQSTSHGNDFTADFAEVDAILNDDEELYAIRTKLMFIRRKAETQRDAAAMNKLASYYKELGEYIQAEECSELARRFSR